MRRRTVVTKGRLNLSAGAIRAKTDVATLSLALDERGLAAKLTMKRIRRRNKSNPQLGAELRWSSELS